MIPNLNKEKQILNRNVSINHNISYYLNIAQVFKSRKRGQQKLTECYLFQKKKNILTTTFFIRISSSKFSLRYAKIWYLFYIKLKNKYNLNTRPRIMPTFTLQHYFTILAISNFLFFTITRKNGGAVKIRGYYNAFPNWTKYTLGGHKFLTLKRNFLNSTITFIKYIKSFFIKFTIFLWAPILTYIFNQRRLKKFVRYQRLKYSKKKLISIFFSTTFLKRALFFVRLNKTPFQTTMTIPLRTRRTRKYLLKYRRLRTYKILRIFKNYNLKLFFNLLTLNRAQLFHNNFKIQTVFISKNNDYCLKKSLNINPTSLKNWIKPKKHNLIQLGERTIIKFSKYFSNLNYQRYKVSNFKFKNISCFFGEIITIANKEHTPIYSLGIKKKTWNLVPRGRKQKQLKYRFIWNFFFLRYSVQTDIKSMLVSSKSRIFNVLKS